MKASHQPSQSPTYQSWASMRARCNNASHPDFPAYGGRGIKVCSRWWAFGIFLADMGERPQGFSIERIDNDGDYEPSNCQWADAKQQANNRRSSHVVEINGVRRTATQWAEESGLKASTIIERLRRGWSGDRLLSPPVPNPRWTSQ